MLIRNAGIDGYPGPVDLRLMHGVVQEIGVGLCKGLYEATLDLQGDELRPCPPGVDLPQRFRRRDGTAAENRRIVPGAREPFTRWHGGEWRGFIDSRSGD